MSLEFVLRFKTQPVNALELWIGLLTAPISRRNSMQFERADFLGGIRMPASAKINKFSLPVPRHIFIKRQRFSLADKFLGQLHFERLFNFLQKLNHTLRLFLMTHKSLILIDDFLHFSLKDFQVFGYQRARKQKVIIKPMLNHRSDSEFCIWKHLQNG